MQELIERFGADQPGEPLQHRLWSQGAQAQRGRVQVHERQGLPDQHFARGQPPLPQALAVGQQKHIAIGALDEFATIAAIEGFEKIERIDQIVVQAAILPPEVASLAQGQVDDGELLGAQGVLKGFECVAHRASGWVAGLVGNTVQSSTSRCAETACQGRSRSLWVRRHRARRWATRPAIRYACAGG